MFTLTIHTDNDAFLRHRSEEIGRILERLARDVMDVRLRDGDSFSLRDINGNTVGTAEFTND